MSLGMSDDPSSKVRWDVALLLIRLVVGWVFVYHGVQKLFGWFDGAGVEATAVMMETFKIPLPTLSAILAGIAETFGGLAMMAGVLVRWAAVPLVVTMIVAATQAHHGFSNQNGGYEYPLVLAAVTTAVGLTGPGRISISALVAALRKGERRPKLDTGVANIRQ